MVNSFEKYNPRNEHIYTIFKFYTCGYLITALLAYISVRSKTKKQN